MTLVSFVIPALNEAEGLRRALRDIPHRELARAGHDAEVLVVDGESVDGTRKVALEAGCRVIVEPRPGYGRAYKTGFEQAKGEVIVTGDADGTYPFDRAHALVAKLLGEGYDFLTTDRFAAPEAGAMSAKHRFGNWVLSTTARTLFLIRVRDSQSGMWVFRKAILRDLRLVSDGMAFSEELKIEAFRRRSLKCTEVPIPYRVRVGEAKIEGTADGLRNLRFLFAKRLGAAAP